jgi:hypothetical protein
MHYGEVMSVHLNVSCLKLLDRCEICRYHSSVAEDSSAEGVLHGLLGPLKPKGEIATILQNVWNYSPSDTSHPRRLELSAWYWMYTPRSCQVDLMLMCNITISLLLRIRYIHKN